MPKFSRTASAGAIAAALLAAPASAIVSDDLDSLSIEELTRIEVTSVSKRSESIGSAPAAIYVISADDIRRSGATSLPQALRLAPNLDVRQIDARQYAISARGFNGYETANKLLVLIDGRSVYSTLFSGVFWELRELPLDEIERIEVVSGPGGTLYGPNAVNGVINVISKTAALTQGLSARATAGAQEQRGTVRYGGAIGAIGNYRLYVNAFNRDGFPAGPGGDLDDGGDGVRGGFRADFGGDASQFTLQGDIFDNNADAGGGDSGHNLSARWTGAFADGSSLQIQAYYDSFDRDFLFVSDSADTFDVSAQHNMSLGRHELVWGGGVRATSDEFVNNLNPFKLDPQKRTVWVGNLFAQDKFALSDRLALTAGIKLERTSFTGLEVLPNIRLAWQPNDSTLFWSAVSRAIRTPSRIDRDLTVPGFLEGGTFRSEELTAFEAGYRGQPTAASTLSISLFYNRYDDIRSTETTPVFFTPFRLDNGLKGETYGVEAWGSYQLASWWLMSAGVTTLHKDFKLKPGFVDIENGISLGNDPDYIVTARSQMNLADNVELSLQLRAVDSLPDPRVASHVDAGFKLAWRPADTTELFVAGTNLFHDRRDHSGDAERGQLVPRRVIAGARVAFR